MEIRVRKVGDSEGEKKEERRTKISPTLIEALTWIVINHKQVKMILEYGTVFNIML